MRSDEEIAKAVEGILRAKSARSSRGAGGDGARAGADDRPNGFRDRADGSGNGRGGARSVRGAGGDGPCGAPGSFLEGLCEEVADHLFELLDAQMPVEAAARLRRHCETCPHCSELAEAEIHVREIVKRSCCTELAPVSLRMRVTNQIAVYRSTTA